MKLLAIDDQEPVLKMLRRQIDCEKLGLELVDTVSSAEDARQLMERETYQIVLCDIEMPEEDGISFAKWALERYPYVKLIFLTSHADFSYVREAVSLHSFDYLLQPASREELEEVIEKAMLQAQIEGESRRLMEDGQRYQLHEVELLDTAYLAYLEGESTAAGEVRDALAKRCPGLGEDALVAPVLLDLWKTGPAFDGLEPALFKYGVENLLDELLAPVSLRCFFARAEKTRYTGFFYQPEGAPALGDFSNALEKAQRYLEDIYRVKATLYYTKWTALPDLGKAHHQMEQVRLDNVTRKDPVVRAEGLSAKESAPISFDRQKALWRELLAKGELQSFQDSIQELLDDAVRQRALTRCSLAMLHQAFSEVLLAYLVEQGLNSSLIFNEEMPYDSFMNTYTSLDSFEEMLAYVVAKLKKAAGDDSEGVVEQAMQYVRTHMEEPIAVGELAAQVGVSPEHLTRLFRKATGCSLKEYLIREKIEASKMLLVTTGLSVTEIAGHVGYGNYNNFNKIFKKYEGCSPAEYRKSQQGEK